jgi:choice-of-anchor A domain-containing protein
MQSALRKPILTGAALLALFGCTSGLAKAQTLSDYSQYNVFLLGNEYIHFTDATGKVAVKGDANMVGYTTGGTLVVGGNLSMTNGTQNADVYVGSNLTGVNMSFKNINANGNINLTNGQVIGTARYGGSFGSAGTGLGGATLVNGTTALPVNFTTANNFLPAYSPFLGTLAATGTVSMPFSTLIFTGANAGLNVFNITASQLNPSGGFQFDAPVGSTVLVNVFGNNPTISGGGTAFNGVGIDHVIYNFVNATDINLTGSFNGSILAPKATVTAGSLGFNGSLIALNLGKSDNYAQLEAHTYQYGGTSGTPDLFTGSLPPSTSAVPEPGTYAMVGFGLLSGVAVLRPRRRK